ncbi:MAG: response regulator [Silvanigrellaceae bacterium]|nr:response regulator [Silvanigrellaceae bacterium]
MKILIVEDNSIAMSATAAAISRYGFEIDKAFDGRVGIEKAIQGKPDLILMDVGLPYTDGISATRQIIDSGIKTKIVGVTANLRDHSHEEYLKCGMEIAYEKPFSAFCVADVLSRLKWTVSQNDISLIEKLPAFDSAKESESRWDINSDLIEDNRKKSFDEIKKIQLIIKADFDKQNWESLYKNASKLYEDFALYIGSVCLTLTSVWILLSVKEKAVNLKTVCHYHELLQKALENYLKKYEALNR